MSVDRNKRTLTVRGTGPEGVLLAGDRAAVYGVGEVLEHQDVVVLTVGEYLGLLEALADEQEARSDLQRDADWAALEAEEAAEHDGLVTTEDAARALDWVQQRMEHLEGSCPLHVRSRDSVTLSQIAIRLRAR